MDAQGALLGLVTSNTRHKSAGTFPHLSFAIAGGLLRPLVQLLGTESDQPVVRRQLRAMDQPRPALQRLWDLGPLSLAQRDPGEASKQSKGLARLADLVQRADLPQERSRL